MVPEMRDRGYKNPMILGPIVGVGGLAMLIPPSALAVVYASLAQISVGKVLIAGAIPGFMLAVLYSLYVVGRSRLNPSIAPAYEVAHHTLAEKLAEFTKYVLPLGFIFFLVLGFIFLGIATPTEAASTGAIGSIILACCYKKFNLAVLKKSLRGTPTCIGDGLYDYCRLQDLQQLSWPIPGPHGTGQSCHDIADLPTCRPDRHDVHPHDYWAPSWNRYP